MKCEFAVLVLALAETSACSGSNDVTGNTVGSAGASSSGGNTGVTSVGVGGSSSGGTASSGNGTAVLTSADCRKEGDGKTTLVFVNKCASRVTFRGSDIPGGTLEPNAFTCVDVGSATDTLSAKRYWGFTGTDPGAEHYSLAEFTFNTDFYAMDWYDISYVDAFNLPLAILPSARPKCRQLVCPVNYLPSCPSVGQFRDSSGTLVSCVSPNRDDPSNPVVLLFEQCDDAYAWSGDDQHGTDTSPMVGCEVEDFDIVFCPGS